MAKAALDDTEEKPLDPAADRVRRKLVRFMAINLGILFVAVMAVVIAFVYRSMTSPEAPPPAAFTQATIALPAGARIVSQTASADRLAIATEFADGRRAIFIYNLAAGRMLGRYDVVNE